MRKYLISAVIFFWAYYCVSHYFWKQYSQHRFWNKFMATTSALGLVISIVIVLSLFFIE